MKTKIMVLMVLEEESYRQVMILILQAEVMVLVVLVPVVLVLVVLVPVVILIQILRVHREDRHQNLRDTRVVILVTK